MFELEKSSLFFEEMTRDYPDVVQNIEIVHENKISLDVSYHNPKHFILNLNNSLRSLLFFIEISIKNSPTWLNSCVNKYRQEYLNEYEILKWLRNVNTHQSLIFPAESMMTGLYRIRSSQEYVAKIGLGNLDKPESFAWDLAMKNTDEIFHDLLVFHSLMFMDLEHSALNECLGITRKWLFHVNFSNKTTKYDKIVDVYSLICSFSSKLLDCVCNAYAEQKGIQFITPFHYQNKEFNCVNTLLEIDLYPSLFSEWWQCNMFPLNYGVRVHRHKGIAISAYDEMHKACYKNLCDSPESYKHTLIKYRDLPIEEFFNEENIEELYSFILFNHWHYKKSFNSYDPMDTPIELSEIMHLQRIGKLFFDEYKKHKTCSVDSTSKNLKGLFTYLAQKL